MKLVQFAIPEKVGMLCAEVAATLAGGATLVPAFGWWVDGDGVIQRERVNWLIVGSHDPQKLVEAIKGILRNAGESAIFYIIGDKPYLEWL